MKLTINEHEFIQAFRDCGRSDNFSREGKEMLFSYLTEIEETSGEEIELDVIAICCDFVENDYDDIIADYGIDVSSCEDADEKEQAVMSFLEKNTTIIGKTSYGVVYQQF